MNKQTVLITWNEKNVQFVWRTFFSEVIKITKHKRFGSSLIRHSDGSCLMDWLGSGKRVCGHICHLCTCGVYCNKNRYPTQCFCTCVLPPPLLHLSLLQASGWTSWWCSWLDWDTRSRTWPSVTPASCTCWWNWRAWSVRGGDAGRGGGASIVTAFCLSEEMNGIN